MSEFTTDHDLLSYEHCVCEHQFIEGNLNCILCGKTIITTTGSVGLLTDHNLVNKKLQLINKLKK